MAPHPTELKLLDDGRLHIAWSDGQTRRYEVSQLREACPCATCRERRNAPPLPPTALPVLSPAETQPLRITAMHPTGRYAYSIHYSDGHDTGIYTLESLREMGAPVD
ncbi:MAG TPA: DUF971 domain-containing protein [Lacipirellulaceae bacterium]|nr:DUF971 domain-containing protein [Lacipirellulaceae bacterium]